MASLPALLSKCVLFMETPEEQRMALYAISTIAGSLMPRVWIHYGGCTNYPALLLLISYPPASGKGKLALLPKLLTKIKNELKSINSKVLEKYNMEKAVYNRALKKNGSGELPKRPNLKQLLVPGNITSSKLIQQLDDNAEDMMVLMFETETDALTNMMGSKFGAGTSVILRQVFHHETVAQSRKTDNEHLDANCPKMAVVLTGTYGQIPKLLHSAGDGLVSRFMTVIGDAPLEWKSVQPCDACPPLDVEFEKMGEVFYDMFHFFKGKEIEVKLTGEQWQKIDKWGAVKLTESFKEAGENATSIAKRHPNMLARLATIFTIVRSFENRSSEPVVFCSDIDFDNKLIR